MGKKNTRICILYTILLCTIYLLLYAQHSLAYYLYYYTYIYMPNNGGKKELLRLLARENVKNVRTQPSDTENRKLQRRARNLLCFFSVY